MLKHHSSIRNRIIMHIQDIPNFEQVVLIDVRAREEYNLNHVPD